MRSSTETFQICTILSERPQSPREISSEITAKVCKRGLRIYQLPISYYGRTYEEGKKITWRDGFKAIWVLFRIRVRG